MELKQHYNYVAFYLDGFKIGRTKHPVRRMRELRAATFELGHPVSRAVALHTESHLRKVLRPYALEGTFEWFVAPKSDAMEVVAFTARTQATLEAA